MTTIEKLKKKYSSLKSVLGERGRRLWAGVEAEALGRGGIALVAEATGLAISTVRSGRDEVRADVEPELVRERRPGGGRPRLQDGDAQLIPALEALVNPSTRGDPQSPLCWTSKSTRTLARELTLANHQVGATTVRRLLHGAGYSLQANAKTKEGSAHPDRDKQFEFIDAKAKDFLARGLPVISVDAKKKEFLGEHANKGQEWQPKGKAVEVLSHDFVDAGAALAIPYGVYDVADNVGFVNVGIDHNTPTFAARSVEKWWERLGAVRYPQAKELFITADGGGSNASRSIVWKSKLQAIADRTGLTIHVSHFPPGTSKWNKVEHRLFSFITINWRGRPLTTYETVVQLIGRTTTTKGLRVHAELDATSYPLRVSAPKGALAHLDIKRAEFHGEWNYSIQPRADVPATPAVAKEPELSRADKKARWAKLFGEQERSGLTHKGFCRVHGIGFEGYIKARTKLLGRIRPRTPTTR